MKGKFLLLLASVLIFSTGSFAQSEEGPIESASKSEYADDLGIQLPADELDEYIRYAEADTILRTAIVLSDIYGKKDMEFTKGFLLGINKANLPPSSVALKVINGDIPQDSLEYELSIFGPHLIFTTHEKDVPRKVFTYAAENGAKVVNAFDVRGDEYLYYPNVYQVLSPSQYFNPGISDYINSNFKNNTLVIVGEPDNSDLILKELILAWPIDDLLMVSPEDFSQLQLDGGINYLIYPSIASHEELKQVLSETILLSLDYPDAGIRVIGRPSWIAFNDLSTITANMDVYIPAKCYFDSSSPQGKRFISAYHSRYGHTPIRSYPVYAAMGYDTANYFLPYFVETQRGANLLLYPVNMIQSYFNMQQPNEGAGKYNTGAFVLHFEPWGSVEKLIVNE